MKDRKDPKWKRKRNGNGHGGAEAMGGGCVADQPQRVRAAGRQWTERNLPAEHADRKTAEEFAAKRRKRPSPAEPEPKTGIEQEATEETERRGISAFLCGLCFLLLKNPLKKR